MSSNTVDVSKRWDEWLKAHLETCKTCQGTFYHMDECNTGMCQEAFDFFLQCMKDSHETPAT